MKRFLITLMAVVSLLPASAQVAAEDSKANQAVATTMAQLHQAMIDRNGSALEALTDEALTYGHSTGAVEDRTTFIANVLAGKSPFSQIEFQDPVIAVRGNVAWARGVLQAQMKNAAGGTDPISFKVLYVFRKQQGWPQRQSWKLLARQSVK